MSQARYNALFLCTGNSARSILGEAVLNHVGGERFQAFSAGSHPKGEVHPLALDALRKRGISTDGLRSKAWDEFAASDAPAMDFIFTVCDNAAGEVCPVWPGQPLSAHWGIPDPAAVDGPDFRKRAAFEDALDQMRNRITAFVSLPLASLDRLALTSRLQGIGGMDGGTGSRTSAA